MAFTFQVLISIVNCYEYTSISTDRCCFKIAKKRNGDVSTNHGTLLNIFQLYFILKLTHLQIYCDFEFTKNVKS